MYLIHEFHNLSLITEINELSHKHSNLLRRACIRRIKILRVTFNFQQPKFQQNVYCIQNRAILRCSVCLVRMRAAALVRSRKPRPLLTASKLDIFA